VKSVFIDRAKQCEKQTYQKEILNKFYHSEKKNADVFFQNFYENHMACQSFCFLLDFIYQHNPYLVNKISEPIFENCTDRLILANHSLKQLNILEDVDSGYNGKYSSVIKMLNLSLTPMGRRKFNDQFLHPTCNTEFLKKEYDITEYILQKYSHYENQWQRPLSEMKDLSKWERQIFLKKITPKAMKQFYKNIDTIIRIYETVIHDEVIKTYITFYEPNLLLVKEYGEKIKHFIESNIDLDSASDIDQLQGFETNFMKKGIDKLLDQKTETIQESEDRLEAIRNYLSQLIDLKDSKSKESKTKSVKPHQVSDNIKIHETEKTNYSLICTSRRCNILESALPNKKEEISLKINERNIFKLSISKNIFTYIKQSSTNNYITNEQIDTLCKMISKTKNEMKDQIVIVYNNIIEQFVLFQKQIERIINFVTMIDVCYTKALIAKKFNYCKPTIIKADKSCVDAKGLRHCLIEQFQNNELYVKNDIQLGNNNMDGILLYGTNAVGKTTIIRALK
jgi:DNA mismatch repair protein MutS